MATFKAFRIHADGDTTRAGIEQLTLDDLTEGGVVIDARYSGVNFKDALAGTGRGKILRRSPLVGGVDVSGVVLESADPRFGPGDEVLVTGCGLSEVYDGGYAQRVRVPADCVVPLPDGLDLYQAMALGTAGFTVALALKRLEDNHQRPEMGPILVTGASGGVGSLAVNILSRCGYEVVAISGRSEMTPYLRSLGAAEVLDRHTLEMGRRPLEKARWGGAVDNVGGEILAWLTRTVVPWGNIAAIGLAGSAALETTVMPFILRGVALLGISSANCPQDWRRALWPRLGADLRPDALDRIVSETVTLEQLPDVFDRVLSGGARGRIVVDLAA